MWNAVLWGALASAALYLGQLLARPLERRPRATGLIMGFGAGTLLSAIAYELVPESSLPNSLRIGGGLALGALAYFFADRLLDRKGGAERQRIKSQAQEGSGMAMFLGALLDGIPEAFILGLGLALGGAVSVAFITAVFVSNIPQGVAGTLSLKAAGHSNRNIFLMWTGLTIASAVTAGAGYALYRVVPDEGLDAQTFAAGALLMMLADSMIPEAYQHGGRAVGLMTVLGYLVAASLAVV